MSSIQIVVTKPEHDVVTNYLSDWSNEVIVDAQKLNKGVKELVHDKANKNDFEKFVKSQKPSFIFLNGHGSPDSVMGHKDEILVKKDLNENILSGSIVYAVSCESALELGPAAVENGARAYIGYVAPFAFLTNTSSECIPDEDGLAKWFKEPSNQVPFNILKGKTAQESHTKSQNKFKELIRKLSSSETILEAKDVRFWLFWDMTSQRLLGDPEARM